jgi:hypothetical protein
MLKYLKLIVFCIVVPNSLAYCQNPTFDGFKATEYLMALSDEILLIKVTNEQFEFGQSLHCTSIATVQVLKKYKLTKVPTDQTLLLFSRSYDCSHGPVADSAKLKRDQLYLLFLSSKRNGSLERPGEIAKEIYQLSDHGLGVQEYNDQLGEFLITKQMEKR